MQVSERFSKYVDKTYGPGSCWEWIGGRDDDGYGRFFVSPARRNVKAHRFALELAGRPAPDDREVAHSCDNPPCVNPAHLSPSTHQSNIREMHARGRFRGGRRPQAVAS